jgi:TfoX/Sxy family transcriptional regulator of competence genes
MKLCTKCWNQQKNKADRKAQVTNNANIDRLIFTEFKKAPQELVDFIMEKMKGKNCDYKKMFGYPTYFVNGNMFVGVHGDKLFLRLSDADIAEISRSCDGVSAFEPMPGRAMKGYVVLPKTVYSDDKTFAEWLDKSIKYTSALPAKKGKRKA